MGLASASYTRRGVLLLGAAIAVSGTRRLLVENPPANDPNDFPVSSYLPPSGALDSRSWRLAVTGAVANSLSLSYSDLLKLPRERHSYALTCITGWSSMRAWQGVPLSALLEMARPSSPNATLRLTSADGHSVTLDPSRYQLPGAIVATHVSGIPLSHDHGFPARLMLPEATGVDNVKWLTEITLLDA